MGCQASTPPSFPVLSKLVLIDFDITSLSAVSLHPQVYRSENRWDNCMKALDIPQLGHRLLAFPSGIHLHPHSQAGESRIDRRSECYVRPEWSISRLSPSMVV